MPKEGLALDVKRYQDFRRIIQKRNHLSAISLPKEGANFWCKKFCISLSPKKARNSGILDSIHRVLRACEQNYVKVLIVPKSNLSVRSKLRKSTDCTQNQDFVAQRHRFLRQTHNILCYSNSIGGQFSLCASEEPFIPPPVGKLKNTLSFHRHSIHLQEAHIFPWVFCSRFEAYQQPKHSFTFERPLTKNRKTSADNPHKCPKVSSGNI